MSRTKKTPFPSWQTAKPNGIEERYIRLGNSIMLHPNFLKLSLAARSVYFYMLLESGGKPIFEFPHSKYKKFLSNGGFKSAREELYAAGFIQVIEQNANLRKANVYQFIDAWKTSK